jgi:transcriptional regulator with XRE-family HTH domain
MNNDINVYMPSELKLEIAERAKALRLQKKLKRTTLAEISGVSASSIKRFETTGQISFTSLLQIANALGVLDDFCSLFKIEKPMTLAEFEKLENTPTPLRGRI